MKTVQKLVVLSAVTMFFTPCAEPRASAAESLFKVYTATEREVIRSMPIEKRPNRVGHFYGNTVRRLNKYGR